MYTRNKMKEATGNCGLQGNPQPYTSIHNNITSLFPPPPQKVNYDLRSNMPISQHKFQTQTHGYHSLRNEGTRLWAALPNVCKEAKDISTFKRMVVDFT